MASRAAGQSWKRWAQFLRSWRPSGPQKLCGGTL